MPDYSVSVYQRTGSPYWWARCYLAGEGGRERRWSTGVRLDDGGVRKSRRVAQERATEQARRLADEAGRAARVESDAALEAVARRLLRQKLADGRRPRAVAALQHNLDKHVLPFYGAARDVTTIRRPDLEAFKRSLRDGDKAPVTINNCLTAIRQVLKQAHAEGTLEAVPHVANVRVSPESKGRALTPGELEALLNAIDPREVEARQYLAFVANTGMRKTETLEMRWGWIDWTRCVLHVPAVYRKGGAARRGVPLNAAAMALLEWRRDHGTKYTGSVKRPLPTGPEDRVWLQNGGHDVARNGAAKRAGLGTLRTHDLRHTRGSLLFAAGVSLPEIRDTLGHTTMAMVNRYAHSYEERLHDAAQLVQVGAVRTVRDSVPTDGSETPHNGPDRAQSQLAKKP